MLSVWDVSLDDKHCFRQTVYSVFLARSFFMWTFMESNTAAHVSMLPEAAT